MFNCHYKSWRNTRIETTINLLGKTFFKDKTIAEVGCGYGDISNYIYKELGCRNILAVDGREEHVEEMERRKEIGEMEKEIKCRKKDCNEEWDLGNVDVIIHWGLLYHLEDPEKHLKDILKYTNYIILETEVCDSFDEMCIKVEEEDLYDQALNGKGSKPSPKIIERVLEESGMKYKMIKSSALNSGNHLYDWEEKGDNLYKMGYRRFWIGWKKEMREPIIKESRRNHKRNNAVDLRQRGAMGNYK